MIEIEAQQLTKRYGDRAAVRDVSFQVQAGELVAFLGVNGAGKSTTLRMLSCYLPPTSGRAAVAGFDVFKQSLEVRKRIGYLPESVPLYPELRVREYLHFRARIKDVPRKKRAAEVARVTGRCHLNGHARQTIGTLSRGYRQRVGLADALLGPPRILFLDEPSSGLDPLQRLEVRALLRELRQDHTVFLSTHILSEAEQTCSRVIILHGGRLVPEDDVQRLRAQARFEVLFLGPEEAVLEALRRLDAVAEVEIKARPQDGPGDAEFGKAGKAGGARCEIVPHPAQDPRGELVALFAARREQHWKLLELRRRALSLDEIFARATGQEPGERPNA